MPRKKKSSKTVAMRKDQQQDTRAPSQINPSPRSDSSDSAVLTFQPDAGAALALADDGPVTPPPTPNRDVTPGSTSPESIVSFVKEEINGVVCPAFLEEIPDKTTPKKKVRSKAKLLKPPSPMKRERTEETVEKPPSPMKREKAEDDCLKEEDETEAKPEEAEAVQVAKQASQSIKARGTLDDYFGCSPREVSEAPKKGRVRVRRSKSAAAAPRQARSDLEAFSLDRHFPIQRRSSRRDEKLLKEMTEREIQRRVVNNIEEGMKIHEFEDKGRGIVVTRRFDCDEFVVEYAGNLVSDAEAKKRNAKYAEDPDVGCYMFWIVHRGRKYCVDATAESGRFGRLINHSRTAGNLRPKVVEYNGKPRLLLFATRQISPGEELLYDYGDRDKQTLQEFPWLKT